MLTCYLFLPQETVDKLHPLPSILNQITESLGPEAPRIDINRYVDLCDLSIILVLLRVTKTVLFLQPNRTHQASVYSS